MTQFGRVARVTVGTLRVSSPLRIAFEIERKLSGGPGKATVRLWNLTRSDQTTIEQATDGQLVIEAGYARGRGLELLFAGRVSRGRGSDQPSQRTEREGRADIVTSAEGTDGGLELRERRVSASWGPGVSVLTVARACATSLGVGPGNLEAALASLDSPTLPGGTVLTGTASRELTRLLASWGLRWSVQLGVLQVLPIGGAVTAQAVRLTPETGLVGDPEVGTRGRCRVTALLTPDIAPGRPVLLETPRVRGRYVCRSVTYSGDTHGADWYAHADLRAS